MDKEKCEIHTCTMEYYSAKNKMEILPFFHSMDGPQGYYAKWSKSETYGPIVHALTDMWVGEIGEGIKMYKLSIIK